MSDITRPNRSVPTTARRMPPPVIPTVPPVVVVPGMPVAPPPAPGTSQTIVYVQVAAPAATPPKKQVEFVPVRRKPVRRMGMLAVVSILTGVIAGVTAYRPEVFKVAPAIAAAGFALGLVALIRSMVLSRTTFGPPLVALAICFVGYFLAARNNARLQGDYDQLRGWTGGRLPVLALARFESKLALPSAAAPDNSLPPGGSPPAASPSVGGRSTPIASGSDAKSSTSVVSPPAVSATPVPKKGDLSFLDENSGGWIDMSTGKPTKPAGTPTGVPPTPVPVPVAPVPVPTTPAVDLTTAEQHLSAARTAAAVRMNLDYSGAVKEVETASTAYDSANRDYAIGSPELSAASQRKLDAKTRLSQLQTQMDADSTVAAAEREVRAAKGK